MSELGPGTAPPCRPRRTAPTTPLAAASLAVLGALALTAGAGQAHAARNAHASLPAIERQVMCVTCKIPLNVAESPQADRERAFIQSLIDRGQSEAEIKRALVGQYGPAVLGLPSTHGFDLAAYLVPIGAVALLAGILAIALRRWRARGRDQPPPSPPALSQTDAARLDADLARFD